MLRFRLSVVAAVLGAVTVDMARAQVVVTVPSFTAGSAPTDWTVYGVDVATSETGEVLVLWDELGFFGKGKAHAAQASRRFDAAGTPLAPALRRERNDAYLEFSDPHVSARRGGWVTSWIRFDSHGAHAYATALTADGAPTGPSMTPNDTGSFLQREGGVQVATVPTGSVFAWAESINAVESRVMARRYDRERRPRDAAVEVGLGFDELLVSVAAAPSGDFLVGWGWEDITPSALEQAWVRAYGSSGYPLGEKVVVSDADVLHAVAVSQLGDVAAAVLAGPRDQTPQYQVRVRYLALDGSPLGEPLLVYQASASNQVRPTLAFDANGNLYVAWMEKQIGAVRARMIGLDHQTLGPVNTLAIGARFDRLALAAFPDLAGFVQAWPEPSQNAAKIIMTSLCAPGSATCGDGIRDPLCERCDGGVANSDSTADACRSDCRPARCGDGVIDGGETCDDGNQEDCDGCSAACAVETGLGCGDGIAFPSCGETCDDTNGIDGDGCSAACTLERIPGGGAPTTDCLTAWSVDNAANEPRFDSRGFSAHQECHDGDARCDFDGGVAGSCTFRLQVCANDLDQSACAPASRLATWELRSPSAAQAATDPVLAAVRDALATAVLPTIVGPETRDLCSPPIDVVVPLRAGPGGFKNRKVTLKTQATDYAGTRDTDTLTLRCDPGS